MELEEVDFYLRDCVEGTIKPLAVRAQQKGLGLHCVVRPDVPEGRRAM